MREKAPPIKSAIILNRFIKLPRFRCDFYVACVYGCLFAISIVIIPDTDACYDYHAYDDDCSLHKIPPLHMTWMYHIVKRQERE